jgi:hypothetical protein
MQNNGSIILSSPSNPKPILKALLITLNIGL